MKGSIISHKTTNPTQFYVCVTDFPRLYFLQIWPLLLRSTVPLCSQWGNCVAVVSLGDYGYLMTLQKGSRRRGDCIDRNRSRPWISENQSTLGIFEYCSSEEIVIFYHSAHFDLCSPGHKPHSESLIPKQPYSSHSFWQPIVNRYKKNHNLFKSC